MTKQFIQACGLTQYAFACGYVQVIEVGGVELKLWYEGGPCYHVRAHDFDEGNRLFWESFESVQEARKFFKQKVKELFPQIFKIKKDKRYSIVSEFCGYSNPMWVVRFCGIWVKSANNPISALAIAWEHSQKRKGE